MKISLKSATEAIVEVRLSNSPVERESTGDLIADLNRKGNWIRGLEVLRSGNGISLQQALAFLSPTKPGTVNQPHNKLKATYDASADAAFLYLPYASPEKLHLASQDDPLLLKCSYTVEDESAVFGLDSDGSLVFVRFMVPDTEQLDSFMELFGSS